MHPVNIPRWSQMRDSALVLGAGAGAVVSLATQQAAIATIPVTALVALGILDRRRLERRLGQLKKQQSCLEGEVSQSLHQVQTQVAALPSPEMVTSMHRAAMAHSDGAMVRLSQRLDRVQADWEKKLHSLSQPDLSHLYQDMAQVQDQYAYVCSTVDHLERQVQRLASQPRMEAAEVDVAQVKTELMQLRVSLDALGSESKAAQSTLQDAVRHLDRRLRQAPASPDSSLVKGEVRELIRAVADLVPRREMAGVNEKLRTMESNQDALRRQLEALKGQQGGTGNNGRRPDHAPDWNMQAEIKRLANHLEQLEKRLNDIDAPFDITAEIRGTTATYLSSMQWQLATLEQATQDLIQKHQVLQAPTLGVKFPPGEQGLLQRFRALPAGDGGNPEGMTNSSDTWVMALRGATAQPWSTAVDRALLTALEQAQQRLVMVWPWSPTAVLDEELMDRLRAALERGVRVELGWCHSGDRPHGELLRAISHSWQLATAEQQRLKTALEHLLPLKKQYPHHFSFKVLGTEERFLVCDRAYGLVALRELPAASRAFPALDMRLRTTETMVLEGLLQRFDQSDPGEPSAYFNRAATRYDLRDLAGAVVDYTALLSQVPTHVLAHNNRAVAWGDQQQWSRALADWDGAIALDGNCFAARCNRGYVHLLQGHFQQAVTDLTAAVSLEPTTPFTHFYLGQAHQKLGHLSEAIAAYTVAIEQAPQIALPYCFRGVAHQTQGHIPQAIADLETAASLLHAQRDHRTLAQITQALAQLKRQTVAHPVGLHTTA